MQILLTVSQAAARARSSERQIERWIVEGKIDVYEPKGNKTKMILETSLAKWLSRKWIITEREKMAKIGIENMSINDWFN